MGVSRNLASALLVLATTQALPAVLAGQTGSPQAATREPDNDVERDPRGAGGNARSFDFGKGNDAYSLARSYAEHGMQPPLNVMIWAGSKGFNYEASLEYLGYLVGLGVSAERLIAPGVDHNPVWFYETHGVDLLRFHDRYWNESQPNER